MESGVCMSVLLKEGLLRLSASVCLSAGLLVGCGGGGGGGADQVRVTVAVTGRGQVEVQSAQVNKGQTGAIRFVPDSGYRFESITGCGGELIVNVYTTPPLQSDCHIDVRFVADDGARDYGAISARASQNGQVLPEILNAPVQGEAVFTAQPASGYHLSAVSGCNAVYSGNTIYADNSSPSCEVFATFAAGPAPTTTYRVSTAEQEGVTFIPAEFDVVAGQVAPYQIQVADGYDFNGVSGCYADAQPQAKSLSAVAAASSHHVRTPPITAECTLTADVRQREYLINAHSGGGGSVEPLGARVLHGQTYSFTVTPHPGWAVASGSGCGGSLSGNVYTTGPVTSDCNIDFTYATTSLLVTTSVSGEGSITPAENWVLPGESANFALSPGMGQSIASVSGCGGSLNAYTYTTGAVTEACTIAASFAPTVYTLTANSDGGGSISPGSLAVVHGQNGQFTVTPDEGYAISSVTGCDGSLSGNSYITGAITSECSVFAHFNQLYYNISANAGEGGSIYPSLQSVTYGQSAQFTITPSPAHRIAEVTGCNGTLEGDQYQIAAVTADCSLSVTFELTLQSPDNLQVTPGDGELTLSWDGVANGEAYAVYAAKAQGVSADNYQLLDGGRREQATATSITLEGLDNGSTYYLAVAAIAGGYQGALSLPVSAAPVAAPAIATGKLNDTGITSCSDNGQNGLSCPVAGFAGQDAEHGRDVIHNDDSDGHAGFSFTKLDSSGNPLPASANNWSCVKDNVTGLIWEIKTNDGGLRDMNHSYSWYNSNPATNGGAVGTESGGSCYNAGRCDTEKFVADVNATGLCGANDWRMPSISELQSIVDYSRVHPAIDTTWFPNTSGWLWSSVPNAHGTDYAWFLDAGYGDVSYYGRDSGEQVRLVRGGQ